VIVRSCTFRPCLEASEQVGLGGQRTFRTSYGGFENATDEDLQKESR